MPYQQLPIESHLFLGFAELCLERLPSFELTSFPSFGFLLAVPREHVVQVADLFLPHGLICKTIGQVTSGSQVWLTQKNDRALLWDLDKPLTGFGMARQER